MQRGKSIWTTLCLVVSLVVLLSGCGRQATQTPAAETGKMKVVATIYPIYEFTRQVAGDRVDLVMLVPAGSEPHDWEPRAKDLIQIKEAKLLLYHGAGLEPVGKLLSKEVLGQAKAVEVSDGVPMLDEQDDHKAEAPNEVKHNEDKGHSHEEGEHHDPHTWLDPTRAAQEVDTIAKALGEADPANKEFYENNAAAYKQELVKLDEEYKTALAKVARQELVTSHTAFGYLAKRYNLTQIGIMGLNPDSEPTPEKMGAVTSFVRSHNVKVIFFETLVSPKLAQTIAKETGAELLVLNPLESLTEDEVQQGKNYLSVMRENLVNLKKALQ